MRKTTKHLFSFDKTLGKDRLAKNLIKKFMVSEEKRLNPKSVIKIPTKPQKKTAKAVFLEKCGQSSMSYGHSAMPPKSYTAV